MNLNIPLNNGSIKYANLTVHIATGLIQGLIFWIVSQYWAADASTSGPLGPSGNIMLAALSAFAVVSGIAFQFGWTSSGRLPLLGISALAGLVYAAITAWTYSTLPAGIVPFKGDDNRIATLMLTSQCSLYILLPYIQVYVESGQLQFPYAELFRHSWNNFFIAAIATLFTGLFWGLIGLWGGLFKMVGIELFADIFFTKEFLLIATPAVFGLGLMLGKELNAVTITLRNVALLVFKTLMPLLTLIALLFIFALPFTGLKPLWDTKNSSAITLTLLALAVLFINAVFQDGSSKPPYPAWLRRGVEGMLLAMPAYAAITLYSIWLRIDQYGFMPERVFALILAIFAAIYSVGYAVSVLAKGEVWLGLMRPVNIIVSIIVMAVAILINTPVLDPISISANSQFRKLTRGHIDPAKFEFQVLKFHLGKEGFEKLNALAEIKDQDHPKAAIIREQAREIIKQESYDWEYATEAVKLESTKEETGGKPKATELKEEHLKVITLSGKLPEGLLSAVTSNLQGCADLLDLCARQKDCAVFSRNMDADMEEEYIFVQSDISCGGLHLFDSTDGQSWSYIGEMRQAGEKNKDREALMKVIEESNLVPVAPEYMELKAAGYEKWHFELNRK